MTNNNVATKAWWRNLTYLAVLLPLLLIVNTYIGGNSKMAEIKNVMIVGVS